MEFHFLLFTSKKLYSKLLLQARKYTGAGHTKECEKRGSQIDWYANNTNKTQTKEQN